MFASGLSYDGPFARASAQARPEENVTVLPFRPLRRTRFETILYLVAQARIKIAIALDSFGRRV